MRTFKRAAASKLAYYTSLKPSRLLAQLLVYLPLRMSPALLLEVWRWAVTILMIVYMFGYVLLR